MEEWKMTRIKVQYTVHYVEHEEPEENKDGEAVYIRLNMEGQQRLRMEEWKRIKIEERQRLRMEEWKRIVKHGDFPV
jgi:hypothetical protein